MQKLKLYDIRKKCFRELSGGQKQRVLIARAMCSNGKLLILDEPVNGLDPSIRVQIYKTLASLNKDYETTIVMVSHDIDKALNYCNKVIEIEKGKITFNDVSEKYISKEGS
jgi:zinc transport system ATP-binding protein